MRISSEFMICSDCAFVAANGPDDCEEGCGHGAGLSFHTVLAGDETDFYVPWRPCPGCGTTLAGVWYPAAELTSEVSS